MTFRTLVALFAVAAQLGCTRMATRRLHCDDQPTPRRREVCQAAGRHSEVHWEGRHTFFPSPSFTVPYDGTTAIYCELHITLADAPELQRMATETPERQSKLKWIAHELWQLSDPSVVPRDSRNHPDNELYRVKQGCPEAVR